MKITIAGGSGFLGRLLEKRFLTLGHEVQILSRSPKKSNDVYWDPAKNEIDFDKIAHTDILINLCGLNIGEEKWTDERKELLISSRVEPTLFLFQVFQNSTNLKKYISASGINCYPLDGKQVFSEEDYYGDDYVSQMVRLWEQAADEFEKLCPVYKWRIAMVLHPTEAALPRLLKIARWCLASPLGSGKQIFSWVHFEDVVGSIVWVAENEVQAGAYNVCGSAQTNRNFMKSLASACRRPMFLPAVPEFLLQWIFGELSVLFLKGVEAKTEKIKKAGYQFAYESLDKALLNILKSK